MSKPRLVLAPTTTEEMDKLLLEQKALHLPRSPEEPLSLPKIIMNLEILDGIFHDKNLKHAEIKDHIKNKHIIPHIEGLLSTLESNNEYIQFYKSHPLKINTLTKLQAIHDNTKNLLNDKNFLKYLENAQQKDDELSPKEKLQKFNGIFDELIKGSAEIIEKQKQRPRAKNPSTVTREHVLAMIEEEERKEAKKAKPSTQKPLKVETGLPHQTMFSPGKTSSATADKKPGKGSPQKKR